MAVALDIARQNPNAPVLAAVAAVPADDPRPSLIGLTREEMAEA